MVFIIVSFVETIYYEYFKKLLNKKDYFSKLIYCYLIIIIIYYYFRNFNYFLNLKQPHNFLKNIIIIILIFMNIN